MVNQEFHIDLVGRRASMHWNTFPILSFRILHRVTVTLFYLQQ